MSRPLEETFNLSPKSDYDDGVHDSELELPDEDSIVAEMHDVSNSEKADVALSKVGDIAEHDKEMDEIAEVAMNTFAELVSLGHDAHPLHAGKMFEVAAVMLKTALDARESKSNRRMKTVELQIRKHKVDSETGKFQQDTGNRPIFDRNELLRIIREGKDS